jgi:hypothetical protein
VYDPPIKLSEALSFDGHLDQWVDKAWRKSAPSREKLASNNNE